MSERIRGKVVPKKENVIDKPFGVGEKIRELKVPRFKKNGLDISKREVLVEEPDFDCGGLASLDYPGYVKLDINNVLFAAKQVRADKNTSEQNSNAGQVIFDKTESGKRGRRKKKV